MMKRLLWAALAVLCLTGTAEAAQIFEKPVALQWVRFDGGRAFSVGTSDGNHPAAGAGIAVAPQDTSQAINVRDHWAAARRILGAGPNGGVAGSLVQDTLGLFGTLTLTSTKWTVDSLVIMRDVSSDGKVWVAVDSIGGHVVADTTFGKQSAVSDSILAYLGVPAQLGPDGIARRVISYSWNLNPWFGTNAVTAQAGLGFNFIRFRIHLTPGDFATAGTSDGYSGVFTYLALEPNYNK